MSLRDTLAHSIAALERITTTLDPEPAPELYQDNEKYIRRGASSHTSTHVQEGERLIRRRASEPSLRQDSANNEKVPSLSQSNMSSSREELDDFEPKLTSKYVVEVTFNFLTVALSFVNPAIAICIIGLAADNIDWATGRGSEDSNTVDAVILGRYNHTSNTVERWDTRMSYLPVYYDTQTFAALIVAGVVCTLGGFIVGPLSVVHWRSTGRSVKLTQKKNVRPPVSLLTMHLVSKSGQTSQLKVLLACVILDIFMFLVAVIVIIFTRELFTTYNRYDRWDRYTIQAKYFDPPLPPSSLNTPHQPIDDVIRYYWSPLHYNPLNWNCRFQGHVSSSMQHRIFQLCNEGVAARNLLAVLVALQGLVLVSHSWAWWAERKVGGGIPWARQRLGSEERIVTASGERERSS